MAQAPAPKAPAPNGRDKLQKEAKQRLQDCKAEKAKVSLDIQECYYFLAPRRVRSVTSSSSKAQSDDQFELQTSIGFEVADDFMTLLIDSFMPTAAKWAERHPDPLLEDEAIKVLEEAAKDADDRIFKMLRASNFYAEMAKTGVPDAAIGVLAMEIRMTHPSRPMQCVGVPIRELEMNLGPDGRINDRWIVRTHKYRDLPGVLPNITLPEKIRQKVEKKGNEKVEVRWGYWRQFERVDDEYWQHVVMVGDDMLHDAILQGEGSCPLIIGRFGATPDFAWPDGPSIKALPNYRMVDEIDAAFIENIDFTLRPPITYPDDGVMSFEDGIEPGMAYPRRPGATANDLQKIYEPTPLDAALFDEQNREKRIRRLHYCDFPEQLGKTPPTASQWLDEMVEAQKKIGTPGYNFWREFPYEAFQRFKFLAELRGVEPLEYNGAKVSLQAYNPAQRAQENQEVLTATRLLQIAGSVFPQTLQVAVDDQQTIRNIKEKLGDTLVALRDPKDLEQAFQNVGQLAGVFGPRSTGGLPASTGNTDGG